MLEFIKKNIQLKPTIQIFNDLILNKNKLVFLDRDGVINDNSNYYITCCSDIVILKGVKYFIKTLSEKGFSIFIVTNQSCIEKKLISLEKEKLINKKIISLVDCNQVIKAVIFCPHILENNCGCKKPKAGMIDVIIDKFSLSTENIENSYFIGDSISNIECANSRGMKSFLLSEELSISDCLRKISEE